ncbi:asparaginyl-tRNA synthetase [Sphaerochaeta pleomorpha str. Grapes]|uniref:Asparagine--tRNA ligase n=1 Tax=Sphaerochaeta pleomorpha (strain ATCC BAA-1885 / DSM 22778 / Grapes) TaxID=158190 RepID=G8QR66_SPHPG|nr:asparagine--tRNA ligase [Sphaerochaeta pleomorpha]AEV31001.1 asparaginyl-tRNA synthetase [Sphaerochaeta pleomorpha str. Grapes]
MNERISALLKRKPGPEIITAEGWVRTKRDSKTVCFLELNDGSCLKGLQVVIDKVSLNNDALLSSITTGSSVTCRGPIVESAGGNQEVEMASTDVTLIGECPVDTYPLQKKRHSVEYLREISHLRPRTNMFGAVARVRNTLSFAVHQYFQENGFVYVNTPLISASDCEGAGEMFQVTTLDFDKVPRTEEGQVDYSKDFFGKKSFLTVSGQLEGETYATALKNIYTFGPTFRAENSNTKRHLAEFWMVEPEMAFCDVTGDMEIAESFLKYLFKSVLEKCPEDMAFFSKFVEAGVDKTLQHVVDTPFAHLTYTEAVKILEKYNDKFDYSVSWGSDLQSEHEKFLTEVVCKSPVIVTDYPKEIKAFYMKLNDDGKTVRGMDVLVPRLGEIIGGSERESNIDVLTARMKELNLNPQDYWWYLDLRRYGSVPHAGFGLGFERAVQYVTGMANIRDVIPYPRAPKLADF